jgi:hypothetical protein
MVHFGIPTNGIEQRAVGHCSTSLSDVIVALFANLSNTELCVRHPAPPRAACNRRKQ